MFYLTYLEKVDEFLIRKITRIFVGSMSFISLLVDDLKNGSAENSINYAFLTRKINIDSAYIGLELYINSEK